MPTCGWEAGSCLVWDLSSRVPNAAAAHLSPHCHHARTPCLPCRTPLGADTSARLAVMFDGPGTLVLDSVSLFPTQNVQRGAEGGLQNPWPFRDDLLGALKGLQPA